jgi:hypothetical protein
MQTPGQPRLTFLRRVSRWFGLEGNLIILLIAVLAIGAGEELWMRFVPKYLQGLGASVFIIGLYDALRTVLAAALGGGDCWNVSVLLVDLVFCSRDILPGCRDTFSRSPFDGNRDAISHQAIAGDVCPNPWRHPN